MREREFCEGLDDGDAFGGVGVEMGVANHHLSNQPPRLVLQLVSRRDQTCNHPDYRFSSKT